MVEPPDKRNHIVVEKLCKSFGDYDALIDIDMRIGRGEIVTIIGGSGAGKTTLLKILIGLDDPTSGAILVGGENLVGMPRRRLVEIRRKFGMVFQYSALLDSMNVLDNLAFPLREHTRLKDKEIRLRVREKLEALDLKGIEQRLPSELSGGMRKRVGLARALMLEPEIILYDEPTSGLDPISSRMVDELIVQTRDRYGVTSVIISHDMAGALRIADYLYLLRRGRLEAEGTPAQLVAMTEGIASDFFEASGVAASALVGERPSQIASVSPPRPLD